MEPTGCTFLLLLLVLIGPRGRAWAAGSAGTQADHHSLRYDLNITSNNQPRCMGQGRMDGIDLLLCDCDKSEVKYVNNMLNGTETLEDMTHKLKETGDLMRGKLPDITPESYTKRDSSLLQVGLMCQCDANGSCRGSLELGFNGRSFLVFDSESGEYEADNPRGELMKEKWQNKGMTKYFQVFLKGDCKQWLQFLVRRKEELETTAAPTTATTTVPAPSPSKAIIKDNIALILTPIFILITLGI